MRYSNMMHEPIALPTVSGARRGIGALVVCESLAHVDPSTLWTPDGVAALKADLTSRVL